VECETHCTQLTDVKEKNVLGVSLVQHKIISLKTMQINSRFKVLIPTHAI